MVSGVTVDMLHLIVRGIMKIVDETPSSEANRVLLKQCKDTLQWLQAQAQEIDTRPETMEMVSASISTVNEMIDCANDQMKAKFAKRTNDPEQVEPFNLVKLFAAWDRDFPGGSAAVLATLEEILSSVNERQQD